MKAFWLLLEYENTKEINKRKFPLRILLQIRPGILTSHITDIREEKNHRTYGQYKSVTIFTNQNKVV